MAYFSTGPNAPIQSNGTPYNIVIPTANQAQLVTTNYAGIITDMNNWVQIQAVYTAVGNETWITLGNFSNDANTPISSVSNSMCNNLEINHLAVAPDDDKGAYYYIDDISVVPYSNPLTLVASQINICAGTQVTLTANGAVTYSWSANVFSSNGNIATVQPLTTTT